MVVLPPGTLLQLMYLGERLKNISPGRFIEVGPGSGEITHRLLNAGWSGTVYDFSGETIEKIRQRFAQEISGGRLQAIEGDFLESAPNPASVDLVISCMVMEHLKAPAEKEFMNVAASCLSAGGRMIALVPASERHWGIEDDVAGHCRRYGRQALLALFASTGWKLDCFAGLTFPLSNLLLPVSNFLVRRKEAGKLELSGLERTKHSGHRNVQFKTSFPSVLRLVLNEIVMLPLHWLQKAFSDSENALVIYFEAHYEPRSDARES